MSGGKIKIPETAKAISIGDQKDKIAPTEATIAALTKDLQAEFNSNPKVSQAETYTRMIAEGKIGKPENIPPAEKALQKIGELRAKQHKDDVAGQKTWSKIFNGFGAGMILAGGVVAFKDRIRKLVK
jgi:hypothetical protein